MDSNCEIQGYNMYLILHFSRKLSSRITALRLPLVNRFTVLNIEEVNVDIHEPIDTPLPSALDRKALSQKPKWEKRLPKQLSTNTLNTCRTSIILPIKISTTDTSKVHSIKVLLDSRAMDNFIDKNFVHTKDISTQSISRPIPVYNVDGSPNEVGQISEVVDVVLRYKIHSKRTVTNFIRLYIHQFFDNSYGLNGTQKPLKRPFD